MLRNQILQGIGSSSCVGEGGVMELTSSGVVGFGKMRGTHRMEVAVRMSWAFPRAPPLGGGLRNAQFQQNPSFCCGYGMTCAVPSLLIMQRRAPCLCNADPCACAAPIVTPVQCRSRCHDLHIGPTPSVFFCLFSTCRTRN